MSDVTNQPGETQGSTDTQGNVSQASATGTAGTFPSASGQQVEFILLAKLDNARVITMILNTLNFGEKEAANVTLTARGIKFSLESTKNRSLQGNTFLQAELFQEYNFTGEKEEFSLQFDVLLDCLKIYGESSKTTALQIAHRGNAPLLLMLEEDEVVTDCGIRIQDPVALSHYNLRDAEIYTKIIMKSESLREAFNELDWSNDYLTWEISPEEPHFRIKARGTGTSCQVDYPRDCEIFELFECTQPVSRDYKMKMIQPCLKALSVAKKTQVRINAVGLLSLQHMIPTDDNLFAFVDFFVVPLEREDS